MMRYIMFKTQAAVIGFKAQGDSRVTDQSQHDVMTSRYIPVTRNNFVLIFPLPVFCFKAFTASSFSTGTCSANNTD